jgi:hypothetical protein
MLNTGIPPLPVDPAHSIVLPVSGFPQSSTSKKVTATSVCTQKQVLSKEHTPIASPNCISKLHFHHHTIASFHLIGAFVAPIAIIRSCCQSYEQLQVYQLHRCKRVGSLTSEHPLTTWVRKSSCHASPIDLSQTNKDEKMRLRLQARTRSRLCL